jgi:HlyD family secretion protein
MAIFNKNSHSAEVVEILSRHPGWMMRSGIGMLLLVFVLAVTLSMVIRYPDVMVAETVVTSNQPPVKVLTYATGRIGELNVADQDSVAKGDLLCVIDNPADWKAVLVLEGWLAAFPDLFNESGELPPLPFRFSHLGEAQHPYNQFRTAYNDYFAFHQIDYFGKTIAEAGREVDMYADYDAVLEEQKRLLNEQVGLAEERLAIDSVLELQGAVARLEKQQSRDALLQKKNDLQGTQRHQVSSKIEVQGLKQDIAELELRSLQERSRLRQNLWTAYEGLRAAVRRWSQSYLLRAPVSGQVAFKGPFVLGQPLQEGEEFATVVPRQSGKVKALASISVVGAAKVRVGQEAKIKLLDYPHTEFGLLRGKVSKIGLLPRENRYQLELELPEGLRTSHGKVLEFRQEMPGTAEIITEDRSLFGRIFKALKAIFE